MRAKTICFLLSLQVIAGNIIAQTPGLVTVARPSPNAQAMQKYGEIPVSAYTGVPSISVPLYTINFRDINIPLSLSYHASGIKVSEEASQVGLGWALNAGGSISRNIIGDDDFDGNNYFNTAVTDFSDGKGPTLTIQPGCVAQVFNKNPGQPTISTYDMTNFLNSSPPSDFQPDQYFFNFLGHSGKFITRRDKSVVLQKQEKLQITCMASDGSAWQIKGVDGTTYDFTQFETYTDNSSPMVHKSAWYLTRITSPAGNTVLFNYTVLPNRYIQPISSYSMTRQDFVSPVTFSFGSFSGTGFTLQAGIAPGKNYSMVLLSSIDFTNGVAQFNYSDNRPDLSGDKRLDSVSIYAKDSKGNISSAPFKTIALGYGFFNYGDFDDSYNAGTDAEAQRLKLMQVQQVGYNGGVRTTEAPYVFNYFEGSVTTNLPSKASFAKDHWGYYNGKTNNSSLIPSTINVNSTDAVTSLLGLPGPERDPDTTYMRAFTLQSIQYPTGGSTEFQYESNDFDEQLSDVNDNSYFARSYGALQQSATLRFNGQTNQYFTTDTFDLTNEYVDIGTRTATHVTLSAVFRFDGTVNCSNIQYSGDHYMYIEIYDSTGTNMLFHVDPFDLNDCSGATPGAACRTCGSIVLQVQNYYIDVPPGRYIWKAYVSGSGYGAHVEDIQTTLTWYTQVSSLPSTSISAINYYPAGGLRIRRIIDHDGINPANDKVKKYIYHYFADKNGDGIPEEYSYGRRMTRPGYSYFDISTEIRVIQTGGGNEYGADYSYHLMRVSDSDIPLNGSALGSVVGYDQVTELHGENGENGMTVYKYINQPDYIGNYSLNAQGFSVPVRPPYGSTIPEALNGELTSQTDYAYTEGGYVPVRSVSNTYSKVLTNENDVYGMEPRNYPVNSYTDETYNGQIITPCGRELYFYNTLRSDWTFLNSTDEKTYNSGDSTSFLEKLITYSYSNPNHMQLTASSVVNSKGQTETTNLTYPLDYTNLSASDGFTLGIQRLQNLHVINAPVEKTVSKTDAGSTTALVTSAVLGSYNAALPRPDLFYRSESASPINGFLPASTGGMGLTKDAHYQPLIYSDRYDQYGNILQQHKVSDVLHSYVWDYNNSLPTAEVTGGAVGDIAYSSFEADGTGNWTIGSGTMIGGGITGRAYYQLNNDISKTGLTSTTSYIVSYWTQNATPLTISGTVTNFPVKGKTINGWTFFEHLVTGQTTITLNGAGNIDELRLYPSGAQMTTYTYDPLVGMTSQTDAGNRVTYYEYDGLARLKRIRDQDYNILKSYEYQYQAPAGCGSGCAVLSMQTFAGTATIGYPVGVFDVHGKLLGNATGPDQYVSLWNNDTADAALGTLARGDSLHFKLSVNAGKTPPAAVTGCRYYQYDLAWNYIDGIQMYNGVYVDFGDGTGTPIPGPSVPTPPSLPPNTTVTVVSGSFGPGGFYYIKHSYPDTVLKTLTIYHNDQTENIGLDNNGYPATSLTRLRNLRGTMPQGSNSLSVSCYQDASVLTVANLTNWNTVSTLQQFWLHDGDLGTNPCLHVSYAQDFMAGNRGLTVLNTTNGYNRAGYRDTTFKLSRLKTGWTSWFTQLKDVEISDEHWDREDLTPLTHLTLFYLVAGNQKHSNDLAGNPLIPIPTGAIDSVINQIAAGSGQVNSNGLISIDSGGTTSRSGASDAAIALLNSKGWHIYVNGYPQ